MISDEELRGLVRELESDRVEKTESINNADKIGEAICAFANDLPDRRRAGVLILGVRDDGGCAGLRITDRNLTTLLEFGRDGRIHPLPHMHVQKRVLDGCEIAVVEVEPSDNPPVKFNGRVCVRRGPQRAFATAEEEKRLTEKRRWGNLPFDQHAARGSTIADLDLKRFQIELLPALVRPEVLVENARPVEQQLRALRLTVRDGTPTNAGVLILGIDPQQWLPGAYVQFLRIDGRSLTDPIRDQKSLTGTVPDQLRRIEEVFDANNSVAISTRDALEQRFPAYPAVAFRELIRNAVIHRSYEGTNAPTRVTWYEDRVEIANPGGPYGQVTTENFGREGIVDYRNPALAGLVKDLGFAQRFGIGIQLARAALRQNGSPDLEFRVEPSLVSATIRPRP